MKKAVYTITGLSPYSQSRLHGLPKKEKEQPDAYERRTWIEKAHFTPDGFLFIPPMAWKQALDETGRRLGKIPGKGMSTYTKHFKGGVLIHTPMVLDVSRQDIEADAKKVEGDNWVIPSTEYSWGGYMNSDGKRGGGTRVFRRFPEVKEWGGTLEISIFDDLLTEKEITKALTEAGAMVGVGRFRPENGGYYGRFTAELVSFESD